MIGIDCEYVRNLEELSTDFFTHDCETVAKALIGTFVFNIDSNDGPIGGRIVETEAYWYPSVSGRLVDQVRVRVM